MNAATIMKLISAKIHYSRNHPRFQAFLKSILSQKIEEGTIIEVTVTRPGEEPVTANLKVMQSDLEMFDELKGLAQ